MDVGRTEIDSAALAQAADLSAVADARLAEMRVAGRTVAEVERVLAKTGDTLVGDVLRGQGTFYEWDHYPAGDVYDPASHAQYYYHAHAAGERFEGEHGHFHTFLRPRGMPPGCRPVRTPAEVAAHDPDAALSHLIAISMDRMGRPFRLFTVNRWVTGETWYAADDVVRMLDRFEIDTARPSWPVNRWIGALVRLFRPQAEALLAARDRRLAAWQAQYPDVDAYEDRRLEVTSQVDVSPSDQIAAVEAECRRRGL
jgi:hypothetical protein